MIEIIPTIVPKSLGDVEKYCERFAGEVPAFHLDATDGDFAFPTTWVPAPGEQLPAAYAFEAHLMAREPRGFGERFIRAGAWRIIGHAETMPGEGGEYTLQGWRAMGAREVGVSLLLETPVSAIDRLAPHADCLHLLSVAKIGAQGQPFSAAVLSKIGEARERYPHLVISVDGGINEENIASVVKAGATRVCVGAATAEAEDPLSAYKTLGMLARSAIQ